MKKIIFYLLFCYGFVAKATIVEFGSYVLKSAILFDNPGIDTNGDYEIQIEEAEAYTGTITLDVYNLSDLTGLEAFVNITYLDIFLCPITSLDVSPFTALTGFRCVGTNITNLDLSNTSFTGIVGVSGNEQLTTINFENANIAYADTKGNNLEVANFAGAVFEKLNVTNNHFVELDFSTTQITELCFDENPELTFINLNNGFDESFCSGDPLGAIYNLAHGLDNLETVCIESLGNDTQESLESFFSGMTNSGIPMSDPVNATFTEDCIAEYNSYSGMIQLDTNNDGCDVLDLSLSDIVINSDNGVLNSLISTEEDGSYQMNLYTDIAYTTSLIGIPDYFTISPTEVISDFVGFGNEEILDFCLVATENINDVTVHVVSIIGANPGFDAHYQLIYSNRGTNVSNGTVSLTYDPTKLDFLSASESLSSSTSTTLVFDCIDLNPLETRVIDIEFSVEAPPITSIGDILTFSATITPDDIDDTPSDNEYELHEEVIGSYDPNDVTVMEGAYLLYADIDRYLHYRIRFQNTGTAPAVNVRVENELDELLDWTTLQILSTSHQARLEIENENELSFFFDNIFLVDSLSDEANSQGYLIYKIKPKVDVAIGDVIENQAGIFFDFNPPIITNSATTEIVQSIPIISVSIPEETSLHYSIYPVPTKEIITISSKQNIVKIEIINHFGQSIASIENVSSIDVSHLAKGYYFIKATDNTGHTGIQKIIKQ